MNVCAEKFTAMLKARNLTYDVFDRADSVLVVFPYKNQKTIFDFQGDDGAHVQLATIIDTAPEDKFVDIVLACNQLNSTYRYVKFIVDSDMDIMARTDAILDVNSADEECFELLGRSLKIISDAKAPLMKAIYA